MSDVDYVEANLDQLGPNVRRTPKNIGRGKSGETHGGDPEPDIGFGQLVPDEKFLALEHLFDFVEAFEQWIYGGLVRFGGSRETGFVNPTWARQPSEYLGNERRTL